jgi:DNA polymerase-3 subunit delta'
MPFRDIHGHRRILELLSRSISHGTLPPSLLFAGPSGAGTRQTAIAVAQAVNCLHKASAETARKDPGSADSALSAVALDADLADACGTCAQCVRIARGVHPDVLVVEPGDSGTIKIDQIRDVVDRSSYRPFEGKRRVVLVDEADALVPPAQNALLKTLEEPPPSSIFILATARPDALLPTVRSRCIRLTFAAGGREEVDADAAAVAQRVLAQTAAPAGSAVGQRLDAAKELLTNTGGSSASDREQVSAHLKAMASLLRDIEVISTRAAGTELANPALQSAIERLAPAYHGERGVRAFAAIDEALEAIERNVGIKVVADWLVLQL